ncbi:hypothetical protein [Alloactinosynnema sp. L-07]|uniref:DUF2231 domain-containing protein n=1 Tax=Alloactinosynnema sp. L-07 TaxID=1653480 RepID=UPI00065F0923|nr:DUF2231 domain-containing protein [Alloactinosynnema sp. L-07]CRK57095.1 hypothetical protein [Alloactinosynnema sp. L-07]
MPEFVDGLPLHPLIVHLVVILIPAAALGTIMIALWPAARARLGWIVVGAAALAALLTPFTANSGKKLAARLPEQELINTHERLGDLMIYFTVPVFVIALGLMLVHRAANSAQPPSWTKAALIVVAILSVGAGVAATVHVYRVGEAGARAVWDGFDKLPVR